MDGETNRAAEKSTGNGGTKRIYKRAAVVFIVIFLILLAATLINYLFNIRVRAESVNYSFTEFSENEEKYIFSMLYLPSDGNQLLCAYIPFGDDEIHNEFAFISNEDEMFLSLKNTYYEEYEEENMPADISFGDELKSCEAAYRYRTLGGIYKDISLYDYGDGCYFVKQGDYALKDDRRKIESIGFRLTFKQLYGF